MADNKSKRGRADRSRVSTAEPYEVRYWTKKLKTTPALLMEAVDAVGSSTRRLAANIGIGAKKKKRKAKKKKAKKRKAKR